MEFFTGLFVGYLLNWVALSIIIVIGILLEYGDNHGTSVVFAAAAALIAKFMFNVDLPTLGIYAVGYFVVGIVWSFIRYRKYVKLSLASGYPSVENLAPNKQTSKIVFWVMNWPFSMVDQLSGDLIDLVRYTVTTYFGGIYKKIYQSLVAEFSASK